MSASSATSGTLGNVPPVSFPGVSSGIDYNAIIQKYTAETLLQEKPAIAQVNNLNAQNTAILKIKSLIGAVQDSLTALSTPSTFNAFKATAANTASGSPAATATQITGQTPIAGTYTINAQTVATATTLTNNPSANAGLVVANPLATAGTGITPLNGSASSGIFTVNGVQVRYDVTTQTITTIVANIDAALSSTTGGSATYNNVTGLVSLTGVQTLGSGGDSGNLEQVLKLDTAPIVAGNVTSSASIGGINAYSALSQGNNAGFATAVTAGTFTVNGVQFTVNPTTQSLSDLIGQINASTAGVTATYNQQTSAIQLISKTAGPQSILIGAGSDTSNFLSAAGLTTGTTTAGTQASLTYTDTSGPHTVYSATNDFTSVIPGIDLNINTSSPALAPGSTYYTVQVKADPTQAEAAIKTFVSAYNAVIQELNRDTVTPTVTAGKDATTGTSKATSSGGGILYGNYQISGLRDQLVQLVSGFIPSGSSSYNSLQSVGLKLDTSSQTVGVASDSDDSTSSKTGDTTNSANNQITVNATSGQLAALDTTAFEAAYASNPTAIAALFTALPTLSSGNNPQPVAGAKYGFAYLLGTSLANIDGLSTFLYHSVINPASLANTLLSSISDSNTQQIDSLEQQINLINQEATRQADSLRAQFSASETQIAQLQALQSQIAAIGH